MQTGTHMTTFVILLAGDLAITNRLHRQVAGARCIAADGGMRHAGALGLTPELWVGDFDSADAATLAVYLPVERETHVPEKAASDGELAISRAIERGATRLVLAGALGGDRTDHLLMNLLLAHRLGRTGQLTVIATSGREEAMPLVPGERLAPEYPSGTLFTVAALSPLHGLTITGSKWELDDVDLEPGNSLTLSNVAGDDCAIMLKRGSAIVLASFGRDVLRCDQ